ncbi:hypothetical protein ABPG72_001462 [Tetrahymena utriculariae]
MQQGNQQNYGNQYQYNQNYQSNQYVPQQFVQYGQQPNYQNQPQQYVITPQYQYQVYSSADQYQPPTQQVQVIPFVSPTLNDSSAQSINSEQTQQENQNEQQIEAKTYQDDQDEYQVHPAMRLFYILKLIVAIYFVAFLIFNAIGKLNNNFELLSDVKYSVNSYNVAEKTYTYYLARDELYKYDCASLDYYYYGDMMQTPFKYFIPNIAMILIWKAYYIYFLFVEIRKCTIGGKMSYQFRNDVRLRDCYNFILDFVSSVALSPFIAFIFSQVNCSSWKFGEKNVIAYPNFFFYNSAIWYLAVFICIIALIYKKDEGYNMRPFGVLMIVPLLTHRIFSICTHIKIPTVVTQVTVYNRWTREEVDSYIEVDRGECLKCFCLLIGLFGQYVIPFYQISGMLLQLPYMLYYTPIYLIVYYCLQIVMFFISIKAHKRVGY